MQEDQKYLPQGLLDDDIPTATSLKNLPSTDKQVVVSAPPVFFNLGYREDFFDEEYKTWQNSHFTSAPKCSINGQQSQITEFQFQLNNTRKLSLQHQEYISQSQLDVSSLQFYQAYSPEEQILNNLQYVSAWSKDQYGSRNLQTAIDSASQYLLDRLFQSLSLSLSTLIYDKFGNYVVQKFMEVGSQRHKDLIYQLVKKDLLFISLHSYGCRVVQKIIEYGARSKSLQKDLMKQFNLHIYQLILNQNGNHIIQRILELFDQEATQTISRILFDNLNTLSFHPFGCRVIQKYLQSHQNSSNQKFIMKALTKLAIQLSKCQYGNYIMQHIVVNCQQYRNTIFDLLRQQFTELSCNKFASNVIEKTIKSSNQAFNNELITKIIKSKEFIIIAKNQYGNYVIQSLIEGSSREKRQCLKNQLKEYCQEISKSQYGRHVLLQMQKYK